MRRRLKYMGQIYLKKGGERVGSRKWRKSLETVNIQINMEVR